VRRPLEASSEKLAGIIPWATPVKAGRDLLRRAFEAANGIGDVVYAPAPRPLSAQNMLTASAN